MRAVVLEHFGSPDALPGVLTVRDVPKPQAGGDNVLVEIRSAGINPSDVKNVTGAFKDTTLPRIPGRDFAGVVVEGPVELLGKEVFGTGGDIGFTRDGSHAQFILLPRSAVVQKPQQLSMEQAGVAGLTFVTAWSALIVAAKLAAGENVLIIGAAGGVGSAAVQIAKFTGARVIGAVRSDADVEVVRELGADVTLNTTQRPLADTVREQTAGKGVAVAFDTSGHAFPDALASLASHGRMPIVTAAKDPNVSLNLRDLYHREQSLLGVDTRQLNASASASLLRDMSKGFDSGVFTVSPPQLFPLSDAVAAYQQTDATPGRKFGLKPIG